LQRAWERRGRKKKCLPAEKSKISDKCVTLRLKKVRVSELDYTGKTIVSTKDSGISIILGKR
jgi:hypothetical protein